MRIHYGSASDIGKARDRNEDSYLAQPPVFAVADGMGGHKGGDVASALAIKVLGGDSLPADGAELVERVRAANHAVYERSSSDANVEGMGTTMTATIAGGGSIRLAHVGDSRAYLLREGTLRRLTEDHTLVQRMVSEGQLTEEEASVHPQRSVITRSLGVEDRVQIDEGAVEVRDGDRILLCTDGLTGMVSEEEIEAILKRAPDPQSACDQLVGAANEAGGLDNITAVVLDVEVDEEEQRARDDETPESRASAAGIDEEPVARGGGRIPRWAIVSGIVALLLVAGVLVGRAYVDHQWYVGVDAGRIAVFQGVPASVGGFELHHVVQPTDLSATSAEQLAVWSSLSDGITADDLPGAQAIVEQIRHDLAAKAAQGTGNGGGAGTGLGGTTGGGGSGGTGSGGTGSGGTGSGGGGTAGGGGTGGGGSGSTGSGGEGGGGTP
ncbi:MAG: Stp1/IreP family PP2C-type Ser/Thr phosphatase [Actinomycetota bacterium]